jgi:hypothetical protein
MTSQFITAIGAFVGTFLGIWIAESAGAGQPASAKGADLASIVAGTAGGLMGTSVRGSDLVIPATAGGKSELRAGFAINTRFTTLQSIDRILVHRFGFCNP